jgi:integrase
MTNACRGHPDRTPIRTVGTLPLTSFAAGATVKVVQQMLGHKSATMTLDLYGHLYADQLDDLGDQPLQNKGLR